MTEASLAQVEYSAKWRRLFEYIYRYNKSGFKGFGGREYDEFYALVKAYQKDQLVQKHIANRGAESYWAKFFVKLEFELAMVATGQNEDFNQAAGAVVAAGSGSKSARTSAAPPIPVATEFERKLHRQAIGSGRTPQQIAEKEIELKERGSRMNINLFSNKFPDENLKPHPKIRTPNELFRKSSGDYDFVVTEDGILVIGEIIPGYGHANLAEGKKVVAAGRVKLSGGRILEIDNTSGHYLPSGKSAEVEALKAFGEAGLNTSSARYVESYFNEKTQNWEPVNESP